MTVLVTGGAGYIGSHTVRELRRRDRDVVVLDNLDMGYRQAVLDAPLVVGDIADEALVSRLCAEHGITAAIHFAAHKNVGESMSRPSKYWHNNVDGTVHLVDALLGAGVQNIVFSSSCSVYGNPPTMPVDESAPLDPQSVYAATKAMIEQVLRFYDTTSGLRSVSLRYFNAAGASLDNAIGEDWSQSLNIIPVVMKAALGKRGPVSIFGNDYPTPDGTCVRDYIHVEDLADVHVKALDHLAAGGATTSLNVGTGTGSSVREVIEATERIGGCTVPVEYGPRREGDPIEVYADPTKVRSTLEWVPKHGLDTIIETAWRWHSTHLDGYSE